MSSTIGRPIELVLTTLGILVLTLVGLMASMIIVMVLLGGVSELMIPMIGGMDGIGMTMSPAWGIVMGLVFLIVLLGV